MSRALGRAAYAADDVAVLCRLDGGEAYIAEAAARARARRAPATTRRARATSRTCSPPGRVMLALGPETALERTRALARERREIFDEEAIRADLDRIREQRFATLLGDAHACVAAPVLGPGQSALRDRINGILREAMRDGRLETIFRRWEMWNEDQPRLYARVLAGESIELPADSRRRLPPTRGKPRGGTCLRFSRPPSSPWSCPARRWRSPSSSACLIASGRVYGPRPLQALLTGYVEVMRGTPLLLQLFVLYFGLASVVQLPAFVAALHRSGPQLRGLRERDLSRRAPGRSAGSARRRARAGPHGSPDAGPGARARRRSGWRWRR